LLISVRIFLHELPQSVCPAAHPNVVGGGRAAAAAVVVTGIVVITVV
jgi:hypothetical protein